MRVLFLALLCLIVRPVGAQTTFFSETFDGVTEPALPASAVSADVSWKTSASSPSPVSGANNGVHTGSSSGAMVLGPVDLSAALDATFTYWARRTSSYSADSLFVRAGTDGNSFGTLLFGGGLPAGASSWEEISLAVPTALIGAESVYLQFDGRGGTSSGSNMRIDDVLIEGTINPSAMDTSFGFEATSLTWTMASSVLDLELDLEWPGPDSVQGLQFDLSWDDAVVHIDSVSSVAGSDWALSASLGAGMGTVASLFVGGDGFPPGLYPGFLTLHVSAVGSPSSNVSTNLAITGFMATTNSPDASELLFPEGHRSLTLTLQPNQASVAFSSETLEFGTVAAGDSALVQIDVSNPAGSAQLELTWTPPGSGPLNPIPTLPASIPFGGSATMDLWLRPQLQDGGQQSGAITISHNTADGATDLSWVALVTGGRGDADGDGAFDVADVVVSLDGTVNPSAIPTAEFARHDLHPFPEGDGQLDIRDVTVAIQAILREEWPDGSSLPLPPADPSGKGQSLPLVLVGDSLWIASPVPLRGMQLVFTGTSDILTTAKGASSSTWHDPSSGELRVISVAGAGESFAAGPHLVAVFSDPPTCLISGLTVDAQGQKIPLSFQIAEDVPSQPEPDLSSFSVYPNPLPIGSDLNLHLPIVSLRSVELFDPIGRRLWHSDERVRSIPGQLFRAPGTYFVRITAGTSSNGYESLLPSGVQAVVVVR